MPEPDNDEKQIRIDRLLARFSHDPITPDEANERMSQARERAGRIEGEIKSLPHNEEARQAGTNKYFSQV